MLKKVTLIHVLPQTLIIRPFMLLRVFRCVFQGLILLVLKVTRTRFAHNRTVPSKVAALNVPTLPAANGITFPAFPAQTDGYCHSFVMDALSTTSAPPAGPCGTITGANGLATTIPCTTRPDRQAPFEVGDYIDYSGTLLAEANLPGPYASPYYISAHTINAPYRYLYVPG